MKKLVSVLLGVSMIMGLFFIAVQAEEKVPKAGAPRLPASLDTLYPPKAQQPVHLLRMVGMGGLFAGIASDLAEQNIQGASDVFEKFKNEYVEMSKLVPEWKELYRMKPVEELGATLKLGDPGKVMPAFGKVGEVCHNCHAKNMPLAQQKYHWGDFSTIKAKDPLSNQEVPFTLFKKFLDASFSGIMLNIQRGQKEKALKQVQGFNARFQTLKTICGRCHTEERKYYTDERVQGLIDKLGQTLENPTADPKPAVELIQRIGMESCHNCHLVHIPAAYAKF